MTWREARQLSYLMHEFDDYQLTHTEIPSIKKDQLIKRVVYFFYNGSLLEYPAKAYFVAIVYAKMLEIHFGIPFLEALSEPDLLIEDKWFVPYQEAKDIYDKIIENIPNEFIQLPSTNKTIQYFMEEFLIGTDRKSNQPM